VCLQAACATLLLLLPAVDAASAIAAAAAAGQVLAAGGPAVDAVDVESCVRWENCVACVGAAAEVENVCVEDGPAVRHPDGLEPPVGALLAASLLQLYI